MSFKVICTLFLSGFIIFSSYCGNSVVIENLSDQKKKTKEEISENHKKRIKELLILAQHAMKEKKHTDAIVYYTKAAHLGDTPSQCFLGSCFLYGLYGTPKDNKKAVLWYRRAAKKGNKLAQEQLARCFADGTVGTKRKGKAAKKSAQWTEESHNPE